ncbi:MAG: RidA family protein [Thermodesulfobacteriota bacterium]
MRQTVTYGQPLETEIGYSRACRVDNIVAVTGAAPMNPDGSLNSPGDLYGQTRRCLEIIADVLAKAGASMDQVIRTRILLTDMSRWKEAAKAHGEAFGQIKPAASLLGTSALIHPGWLVEIEADAVIEAK